MTFNLGATGNVRVVPNNVDQVEYTRWIGSEEPADDATWARLMVGGDNSPPQIVVGDVYIWHIYPTDYSPTGDVEGRIRCFRRKDEQTEDQTVYRLYPSAYYAGDVGEFKKHYPADAEAAHKLNCPSFDEVARSVPYMASPAVITVPLTNTYADKQYYLGLPDDTGAMRPDNVAPSEEVLVLAGGYIRSKSGNDYKYTPTNLVQVFYPTARYIQGAGNDDRKTELANYGIKRSAYCNKKTDTHTAGPRAGIGSICVAKNVGEFLVVGGIPYNYEDDSLYMPHDNDSKLSNALISWFKVGIGVVTGKLKLTGQTRLHNVYEADLSTFSLETSNGVENRDRLVAGSIDDNSGAYSSKLDDHDTPLIFPRLLFASVKNRGWWTRNMTAGAKIADGWILWGSMGLGTQYVTDNKLSLKTGTLLFNQYGALRLAMVNLGDHTYEFYADALNVAMGVGALDGCIGFYDDINKQITFLGGRQLYNGDSKTDPFDSSGNYAKLLTIPDTIDPEKPMVCQPYSMEYHGGKLRGEVTRGEAEQIEFYYYADTYNFGHDVLSYALLYGEALPMGRSWLICSSMHGIEPMIVVTPRESSWLPNDPRNPQTKDVYYLRRRYNFYPVETGRGTGYVKARKQVVNIDPRVNYDSTIGSDMGDRFVLEVIPEQEYVYYEPKTGYTLRLIKDSRGWFENTTGVRTNGSYTTFNLEG